MVKYVSFCRGYGEPWAFMVLVQNTERYTRRDYKEVLGVLWARVVSGGPGVYADVFRVAEGHIPVRVLQVECTPSMEEYPAIKVDVCVNDKQVRKIVVAE